MDQRLDCDHPCILLVEDAPEVRLLVRGVLESENFQVHTAETGAEALHCMAEHPVDLLLLDLDLPDVQGTALCRQLRADGVKLPIVMLTCHNQGHERVAGLDCGADDYVGKPFAPDELLARIRAQLRREERFSQGVQDLLQQRWGRIEHGLRLAQQMQQPLISSGRNRLTQLSSAARHVPIGRIGGDFYILEQVDEDRSVVVVADTMGKGLGAALVMSWTLSAVHELVLQGLAPQPLIQRLNQELGPDLEKLGVFVALFCGLYDHRDGAFAYCSAGCEPPILIRRDRFHRRHRRLSTHGIPVGVLRDFKYRQAIVYPRSGDQLFLYTDGLTESVAIQEQSILFRSLYRVLLKTIDQVPAERADALMDRLRRLTNDDLVLKDDLTYVLLSFPGNMGICSIGVS